MATDARHPSVSHVVPLLPADLMSRRYPDRPWLGVGVIVWREDRVLLVRRGRPPRQGEWGLPGGVQELGETVFAAAAREVREETGIESRPCGVVTVVDSITRDAAGAVEYHYTLVEVSADWVAGEPVAASDVDAVRWATLAEAGTLVAWEETRRVLHLAATQRAGCRIDPS